MENNIDFMNRLISETTNRSLRWQSIGESQDGIPHGWMANDGQRDYDIERLAQSLIVDGVRKDVGGLMVRGLIRTIRDIQKHDSGRVVVKRANALIGLDNYTRIV